MQGNEFRDLVFERMNLRPSELVCPRELSCMTPCVARDGDLAMLEEGHCAGCYEKIVDLIKTEIQKHAKKS